MGFVKRYKGRGSYDLLSNYNHFMPGFSETGWLFILFLLGSLLGSIVVAALGFIIPAEYMNIISYPIMFIPAMLYASNKSRYNENFEDGYKLDNNNFKIGMGIKLAFAAMVMTLASAILIEPANMLLPPMPKILIEMMENMMTGPAWVTFISVSIFAPFFEEWLCRGLILRGLIKRAGPAWAIILSALFFAIIHMNPWQALPAFIMGIIFGYVYYKTGSLKLTMLMHFTNNTLVLALSLIPSLQEMEYLKDVLSPWAYGIIYALAAVALICGLIIFKSIPQKEGYLGGCQKIKSIF